jgi:AcrR family transcriptional regulator
MEQLIIQKARDLFFSYGLKSVSMDDLAKQAGISKKTIYQFVSDKNELIEKVVEEWMLVHKQALKKAVKESDNAVEELFMQDNLPFSAIASVNIHFFHQLEKFFPAVWKTLEAHKQKIVRQSIVKNLQRGIQENHYRNDLDVQFLSDVRLQQISTALNPVDFTERRGETKKLMYDFTVFYLHSVVNANGKRVLNKFLKNNNGK